MTQRTPAVPAGRACEVTVDGHCAVCGDEALVGTVVAIERAAGTAVVNVQGTVSTVALDLVDEVAVGDAVLVHQGFAIARVEHP